MFLWFPFGSKRKYVHIQYLCHLSVAKGLLQSQETDKKKISKNTVWEYCTEFMRKGVYILLSLKSKAESHLYQSSYWQCGLKMSSTENHFSGRSFSCPSRPYRIVTEKKEEPQLTQPWTLAAGSRLRQARSCLLGQLGLPLGSPENEGMEREFATVTSGKQLHFWQEANGYTLSHSASPNCLICRKASQAVTLIPGEQSSHCEPGTAVLLCAQVEERESGEKDGKFWRHGKGK